MTTMTFAVAVGYGDTEAEIQVSDRDAALIRKYAETEDSFDEVEELAAVWERVNKKIKKALEEQIEPDEDIDIDDLEYSFNWPEEEY